MALLQKFDFMHFEFAIKMQLPAVKGKIYPEKKKKCLILDTDHMNTTILQGYNIYTGNY